MENTAKNFALQLGSLVALYATIGSLIALLLAIITVVYPDAAAGYYEYEGAASSIRFAIASLIVVFPAYLVLTRLVNQVRRTEQGTYLTLTKWLIYLSLLIGGSVLLGDLIMVINSFLNGELTIRFVLKALSVLIVVGTAFSYYLLDARGYWQKNEKQSIQYGGAAVLLVLAVLVLGFFHTETPAQVREMRIDEQQLIDLQNIQSMVQQYYQLNTALPQTISELYVGMEQPVASEGRDAYSYAVLDTDRFELCATFAYQTPKDRLTYATEPFAEPYGIKNPYNWDHGADEWCFERVVSEPAL